MNKKLRSILRAYAMGMGIKETSGIFYLSRNTIRKYFRRFQESGLSLEQLLSMSDHHLHELFAGEKERDREPSSRYIELEALLPDYVARLSRKGVTKKQLYEEYSKQHPEGYKHACFCRHLQQYMVQTRIIGHVEHHAGDQMYIDFAGDKLEVADAVTGEVRGAEVFVAILPCSHYTYCEAVWSQTKEDLISACENALHFFGGAPMAIVPDNLKSAVVRNNRNEPIINEDFAAFAEHYECAVYPARVRHPKDKALVENAVKLMYRSVYVDIEGMLFNSLDALNASIWESLHIFNNKKMAGRKHSRKELFDKMEADYLRPLPTLRYQMKERKSITVMRNGYITLFKHHYSLPKEYVGKRVDVVFNSDILEIYYGLKLVTTHHRDDTPYEYTQKPSHNLPGRQGSYEKDINEVFMRAGKIDNIILNYFKEVQQDKKYPPIVFKSCRGILSLEKKFGQERLIAACTCASMMRRYGYNDVLEILEKGDDAHFMQDKESSIDGEDIPIMAKHKNIRGKEYYSKNHNTNNLKSENYEHNGNK